MIATDSTTRQQLASPSGKKGPGKWRRNFDSSGKENSSTQSNTSMFSTPYKERAFASPRRDAASPSVVLGRPRASHLNRAALSPMLSPQLHPNVLANSPAKLAAKPVLASPMANQIINTATATTTTQSDGIIAASVIIKEGYLFDYRKGSTCPWERRYFRLTNHSLVHFQDQSAANETIIANTNVPTDSYTEAVFVNTLTNVTQNTGVNTTAS